MDDQTADPIGNPPRAMVIGNETLNDNPTSEGLPGEPDDGAGHAQVIKHLGSGFRGGTGKGALELDFAIIGTEPLDDSSATSQDMDSKPVTPSKAH